MKAWSKTMGGLELSSGESELAAVVRAATEGLGLQSILSDFDLWGHVAIKSDAKAAIWDCSSTRIRNSSTFWLWEICEFSDGEEKIDHKSRTRRPILLMVTRCAWAPNGLQPWERREGEGVLTPDFIARGVKYVLKFNCR